MATAQLFDLLHELRLPGMREEIEHQFENPQYDTMPFSDRAMRMAQAEVERRYLRGLVERAQIGELHLDRSFYGRLSATVA